MPIAIDLLPFDDTNSDLALYLQVARWIEENIDAGKLEPGTRLPTIRILADHLRLNRGLIAAAYAHLTKIGVLYAQVGNGTFVRTAPAIDESQPSTTKGKQFWEILLAEAATRIGLGKQSTVEILQDSSWVPDHGEASDHKFHIPMDIPLADHALSFRLIQDSIKQIAGKLSREMLTYSHPQGIFSLRNHLVEFTRRRNIITSANEIMITNGAQQALSLLSTLLLKPGDVVITENPGYLGAIRAFRMAGANVIGIPMDDEGIRLDVLEGVLRNHRAKIIYTIPSFQAPTGVTQNPERRHQLYELARRYKVPIVEDGYVSDLYYGKRPPDAIKSIDTEQLVIYIGTFSKTLGASIRLGWISANSDLITRLTQIKEVSDIHSSIFSQLIVDRILEEDLYEPLLKKLRAHYGTLYALMGAQIRQKVGLQPSESEYAGGFSIWAKLPPDLSASDWLVYSRANGVPFDNGLPYFVGTESGHYARFCFSLLSPGDIEKATDILVTTMQEARSLQRAFGNGNHRFLPFS